MGDQRGFTTAELLVVIALGAVTMAAVATFSVPLVARETMTGAIYSVQNHLQLARIEAASRNRLCRFVVDTGSREIQVLDSMGTSSTADDVVLHGATLPATITFARPDAGMPVTLDSLGGSVYGAAFRSDGIVDTGSGDVILFGGDDFRRVSLFAGGGTALQHWSGSTWVAGS